MSETKKKVRRPVGFVMDAVGDTVAVAVSVLLGFARFVLFRFEFVTTCFHLTFICIMFE